MALPPDVTIADVVPTLQRPVEYVRVVLANMFDCQREHGNASVRIGITGTGQVPYHKVAFATPDGREVIYNAYDGAHPFKGVAISESAWSNRATTLKEVQTLLGSLRGANTKR